MNFGEVIQGLKQGKCYQRSGWNGKGMFICKQVPCQIGGLLIQKLQSLPDRAKELIMSREGTANISYENQMLIINPNGRADSWVPSSSDVFAEDWQEV